MQYLLMIYGSEADMEKTNPAARAKMSEDYAVFTRDIIAAGNFKGGERLHPTASATTVRAGCADSTRTALRNRRPPTFAPSMCMVCCAPQWNDATGVGAGSQVVTASRDSGRTGRARGSLVTVAPGRMAAPGCPENVSARAACGSSAGPTRTAPSLTGSWP